MRKTRILCLFPFQHNQQMSAENSGRGGRGDTYSAPLDNTDVVSHALENADQEPILLPMQDNLLMLLTKKDCSHPLHKKMRLVACLLSGTPLKAKDFPMQQPILSCLPGDCLQRLNMTRTLKDGFSSVLKGRLIQFHHL